MKSERTAGGHLPVRLGWGPPESDGCSMATDDRHTPHELDQDQQIRSRGRTSRAARALNERSRDLIESRFKRLQLLEET